MKNNNKAISEQEIKAVVREITHEPNEEYIKKIKVFFEDNTWLLEKLTDEQLKMNYIKLLYNYEHLHRDFVEHSKENEILGKMVLGIILKYSKKKYPNEVMSDKEIDELLNQTDWREKAGFSVDEKGMCYWKGIHSYQAKPQEIITESYLEQEKWTVIRIIRELELDPNKYLKLKDLSLKQIEEKLKETNLEQLLNESLDKILKDEDEDDKVSLDKALDKILNKEKEVKKDLKENKEKLEKELKKLKEENEKLKEQNKQLIAQIEVKK